MEKNNHATSTVNGLFSNDEVIINKKRKKITSIQFRKLSFRNSQKNCRQPVQISLSID